MRETVPEQLVVGLEIALPGRLALGRGNAMVIAGHCYHPSVRTRDLWLEVDGDRQPVDHHGLPRQDVFDRAGPKRGRAFKSGFVGIATVSPRARPGPVEVSVAVELEGGRRAGASLGSVTLEPALATPEGFTAPAFDPTAGPRVAICMATYNPPLDLLRSQLDSIRAQTHQNWICVISDDGSDPQAHAGLRKEIDGDGRFALSPGPQRLGFYRNFERALSLAPASAEFVTLCDQDDRWNPDKLERLLEQIGGAQLAYSDARVVTPDGEVVQPSYWTERRNNYTNFGSLLLANSVTGAASLFRRELLDDALPFPPKLANPFHDHWLAVVALARGEITYIGEPLYDYVQHPGAVIGHSQANRRPRPVRQHLMERLRSPGDGSRAVYYYDWYQQLLFAEVLRQRCWERMTPSKRRTLRRLREADRGLVGLTWLLGRRLRRLWGYNETLDRELFYAYALVRRRAVSLWTLARRRPSRRLPRDARVPPAPGGRGRP